MLICWTTLVLNLDLNSLCESQSGKDSELISEQVTNKSIEIGTKEPFFDSESGGGAR